MCQGQGGERVSMCQGHKPSSRSATCVLFVLGEGNRQYQYATCNMQHKHAVRRMQSAVCNLSFCCLQAIWNLQFAIGSLHYATCNVQSGVHFAMNEGWRKGTVIASLSTMFYQRKKCVAFLWMVVRGRDRGGEG
ncbi:unnamed protein product [Laminaria digitata]